MRACDTVCVPAYVHNMCVFVVHFFCSIKQKFGICLCLHFIFLYELMHMFQGSGSEKNLATAIVENDVSANLCPIPLKQRQYHSFRKWLPCHQCLIQDKISTSPPCAVESRRTGAARASRSAIVAQRGRRIGRYHFLIILS